jgi:nicotinate-nucleotide pyrophosphorylase (carboxylating)
MTRSAATIPLHEVPAVAELIALAKREDLGAGDITTRLLPDPHAAARFDLMAKQPGVLAGREIAEPILHAYDSGITIKWQSECVDGWRWRGLPATLATLAGPLGAILAAERVFLNFLQRLCGVATRTRSFVDAIRGTRAKIYDTRKTAPGWRALEKYAVCCGGGCNHRSGLHDAVLIKDNHLAGVPGDRLAYAVFEMLNGLGTERAPGARRPFVQVECASVAQCEVLLKVVGIDSILLDNFTIDELRQAVSLREAHGLAEKVSLEASGGITLDNVRQVAETGVERISVGSITHSATAIDLSLERL